MTDLCDLETDMTVELHSISELASLLDAIEMRLSVSPARRRKLALAAEEIIVNAFRHAAPSGCQSVSARFLDRADGAALEISYVGEPFDPSRPDAILPVDPQRSGGDGLRIAHHVVDRIAYERVGECNLVTLFVD